VYHCQPTFSRLDSVTDDGSYSATYSHLANSPRVSQITYQQGIEPRMTTTKQFDYVTRLRQVNAAPAAAGQAALTSVILYRENCSRKAHIVVMLSLAVLSAWLALGG
jgi:hypothetical protein